MSEKDFIVRDGGDHTNFETGSKRSSAKGKGRFDLIPAYPMRRLAQHYEKGSAVYGDRNWEKGQPLMRYICSAESHLSDLKAGDKVEDHCSAIMWNIAGYMHTLNEIEAGRLPASLDDRPERMRGGTPFTPVQIAAGLGGNAALQSIHTFTGTGGPGGVSSIPAGAGGGAGIAKASDMKYATLPGGKIAHLTAWSKGGCAWCGNISRNSNAYICQRCNSTDSGAWTHFTETQSACDKFAKESK